MDNTSPAQSFQNLHHHRHRPSLHLTLPHLESPVSGYQLPPESTASVQDSLVSSGPRKGSSDGEKRFQNTMEADVNGHYVDTWFGMKEEVWGGGEGGEGSSGDAYGKDGCYGNANGGFYSLNCDEEGLRRKHRTNYNSYGQVSCDANREAHVDHQTKHGRGAAGGLGDGGLCRAASDGYLGREEEYGSGEEQIQPWFGGAPSGQTGDAWWRGQPDLSEAGNPQKLDSFSDAFFSQRRRQFPLVAVGGDSSSSSSQAMEFGRGEPPGFVRSRHSCAFDSDPYPPPSSFPSPPASSHLAVLSPPPTPLPPPPAPDSPCASGGGGPSSESYLQFFASRLQPLSSAHPSAMMWKIPLVAHCFPQPAGDPSGADNSLRSSLGADYGNITAQQDALQSPELTFHTSTSSSSSSSSHHSSLHPPPASTTLSSPPPSHHLVSYNGAPPRTEPYGVIQKVKDASVAVKQLQKAPVYAGSPFASVLHSRRGQRRGHYTPPPLLNPLRRGTGLHSSLLHHREERVEVREEEEEGGVLGCVNVGSEFQAEIPPWSLKGHGCDTLSPEEESPREQLLWKPWPELEEGDESQNQVERLLSLCSSSCLPGGGSNTELALHCLHLCQGNTMDTLGMLLFGKPSPAGDYHYSGSDFWTEAERSLFSAALGSSGKDFSLIEKTVATKTASQCVEFYYLSKKLLDKQRREEEEERKRDEELERSSVTPICQPVERRCGPAQALPAPSLATFFPCKLCGKMFYKIKSRNAHMKIHRQPQDDWADRRLQHQLLTQRLAIGRSSHTALMPATGNDPLTFHPSGTQQQHGSADNNILSPGLLDPGTYNNMAAADSRLIAGVDSSESGHREPVCAVPFHQTWGVFGPGPSQASFYCGAEVKEEPGAGTMGGKEPMDWH